jgi:hypothetical protein
MLAQASPVLLTPLMVLIVFPFVFMVERKVTLADKAKGDKSILEGSHVPRLSSLYQS